MSTTLTKKPVGARAARASATDPMRAYQVQDIAGFLQSPQLPRRSRVLVIPETSAAEAELQENRALRRMPVPKGYSTVKAKALAAKVYEPDARARAILRGREYARQDLEAAGGAYDLDEVRSLLSDVSRQAVDKKVADGSLLAVPGPSNRRRFPTAQFNTDGSLVEGLKEVRAALGYSSDWAVLNFLVNGHDLLGNKRPIDVLRHGGTAEVVGAAKRTGLQGG